MSLRQSKIQRGIFYLCEMTTTYKNAKVHYTNSGKGKPLVFLHGFLENSNMWKDLIQDLPKNHRSICIDLPGHGHTENFGYIHTMEDMADMVFYVLNSLEIESAYVIGHSMGGYVALALAEKHPNMIEGLCLMNSTFEADSEERKEIRQRAIDMATTNYESLVRMSFANLFAPESKDRFKSDYDFALSEALKTSVQGYIAAQKGMMLRKNHLETLKQLGAKKVILIGQKDPVISGESIKKAVERSTIEIVELSEGHMSHIENKSELSYFIRRFIE